MSIEIIPAIIPKTYPDLVEKLGQVAEGVDLVQLDVMDGRLVPVRSWPYPSDGNFQDIISDIKDFPFLSELEFEVDMMVSQPEVKVEDWIRAGARRIIIHRRSTADPLAVIDKIRSLSVSEDSLLKVEVGMAIAFDEKIEVIAKEIEGVDFVQCMGITNIGYQNQDFAPTVVSTIKTLRERYPQLIISIDGGVKPENIPVLVKAGADRLVIGSAIFSTEEPAVAVEELRTLVEGLAH